MTIQRLGLNLTNLQNITAPDFDIKNNTIDFFNDIPIKANTITGGYLGLIVSFTVFFFLYWKLSQESFYGGDYGLSYLRSLGVACAITSIMGLLMLNMGYWTNYYHIVIFLTGTFMATAFVWKAEK